MLAVSTPVGKRDAELRRYLKTAMRPDAAAPDAKWEKWLRDNSVLIGSLDREAIAEIDRELGLRLDGQPTAATTANRTRIVARACVVAAVAAGAIHGDPWPPLRVYDCRHAAATSWLKGGLSLGDTARRLGHSVDTLVSTYVGALDNEEAAGNAKVERFLAGMTE